MREIKLRYIVRKDGKTRSIEPITIEDIEENEVSYNIRARGYKIIDRNPFTGLKDKNGKEIYEGDIVVSDFRFKNEDMYQIVWVEESAEFFIQNKDICGEYVEIIGNIYENPELLNET